MKPSSISINCDPRHVEHDSGMNLFAELVNSRTHRLTTVFADFAGARSLPVEHFYPGMPAVSADEPKLPPKITQEIVTVHFVALPFVSRRNYGTIRAQNDALQRRRSEFVREHLKGI